MVDSETVPYSVRPPVLEVLARAIAVASSAFRPSEAAVSVPPLLIAPLLLAACAHPPPPADTVSLPRLQAWVDGRRVDYVTTDISDGPMAAQAGVNHVPRLRDALGQGRASITERVYKFSDGRQISVFPSAPAAAGAPPVPEV